VIELVFFEGCPNVDRARAALRAALSALGRPAVWTEWELDKSGVPERIQGYGSPTVLVDGRDVRGSTPSPAVLGPTCRGDGPPSADEIRRAVANSGQT
jgi:hypothetical protein